MINKNCGFTLIETIIYISIFALIMTGALVSVYAILGSQARNQAKAMVAEEGIFLLGKIDYILSGTKTISLPNVGVGSTEGYGNTLQIIKFGDGTNIVKINLNENDLQIAIGSGDYITLNNSNVKISCPFFPPNNKCFKHESPSGDGITPKSIEVKFKITSTTSEGLSFSQDFSTIKYLRK